MIGACATDDYTASQGLEQPTAFGAGRPSLLVAIASYGTGQDHFLEKVIAEYRKLNTACRIVVLSNIDKPVQGAEVLVGLPSRDPYSLPFAHRKLFRDNVGNYDLFVYTEDDTLITVRNICAFVQLQEYLEPNEILGFLRSETDSEGKRYVVSANHQFRWLPDTVVTRGAHQFAQFSNLHSGCFIATQRQLTRAIASGGFTLEPRADRYGMLETAASDIYSRCGLKRLICLTQMEDFIVPHLANKYYGEMGVPSPEFDAHVKYLLSATETKGLATSLFDPETRAPEFRWSKHLYRRADEALLALVPPGATRILSIGAASGSDEVELLRRGLGVSAVPLDPVFGDRLRRRGVHVHAGSLEEAVRALGPTSFDVVLAADVLHLVRDPSEWLRGMASMLAPDGVIVGSVSRTASLFWALKDWRSRQWRWVRADFQRNGAHPMSERRLVRLLGASALELTELIPSSEGAPGLSRFPASLFRTKLAPRLLFRARRMRGGMRT